MESSQPAAPPRGGSCLAIVLASIALILAIIPYLVVDRVQWPGVSFIKLRDQNTGEDTGFIKAEYGSVMVTRLGKKDSNRLTFELTADNVARIEIHKADRVVARWSVSEAGESFEKLDSAKAH